MLSITSLVSDNTVYVIAWWLSSSLSLRKTVDELEGGKKGKGRDIRW